MCGRFNDHLNWENKWRHQLGCWPLDVQPSFNKAPTQLICGLTSNGTKSMRWGLIPAWSKQPTITYSTFNARIEDIDKKPAYQAAWREDRRCLIPCAGYYEWQNKSGIKQPYYLHSPQAEPLFMAGLWEERPTDKQPLMSCSIITRPPTHNISHIHHRMPMLIHPDKINAWLQGTKNSVLALSSQDVSNLVTSYPVSEFVNKVNNNNETCIQRIEADTIPEQLNMF